MVTTNIVRKVDRVGRVSLPLSLRERLGFAKQDPLEMHAEENRIIVQRYIPACFFCGSGEGLKTFHSVPVVLHAAQSFGKNMRNKARVKGRRGRRHQ